MGINNKTERSLPGCFNIKSKEEIFSDKEEEFFLGCNERIGDMNYKSVMNKNQEWIEPEGHIVNNSKEDFRVGMGRENLKNVFYCYGNGNYGGSQIVSDQSIGSINMNDTTGVNNTFTFSSSTTSVISTPSNNIRRFQGCQMTKKPNYRFKKEMIDQKQQKNSNYVKSRLMSFLRLHKKELRDGHKEDDTIDVDSSVSNNKGSIVKKEIIQNANRKYMFSFNKEEKQAKQEYDYSVFVRHPWENSNHQDYMFPVVRDSQIAAWESAERVVDSVIFNKGKSSLDDFDKSLQLYSNDNSEKKTKNKESKNKKSKEYVIKSIPGYCSRELEIIQNVFSQLQNRSKDQSLDMELEKTLLDEYKKLLQLIQQKIFTQSQSFLTKRQIQIFQKKKLLAQIFGLNNNLNLEYITQNTLYSVFDSSYSIHKTFHEDKNELTNLINEDKAFNKSLEKAKKKMNSFKNTDFEMNFKKKYKKNSFINVEINDFVYEKFQATIHKKLDEIYDNFLLTFHDDNQKKKLLTNSKSYSFSQESNDELQLNIVFYLRKCLKKDLNNFSSSNNDDEN